MRDFDWYAGFHHLVPRPGSGSADVGVWTTSWWINLGCFFVFAVSCGICGLAYAERHRFPNEGAELPVAILVFLGFLGLVLFVLVWAVVAGIFYRGRLEIDVLKGELRFVRGMFWRVRSVIPFHKVRALTSKRIFDAVPAVEDDGEVVHRVVVAELDDERLVLIAVNPNWRRRSLFRDIENAINEHHRLAPAEPVLIGV